MLSRALARDPPLRSSRVRWLVVSGGVHLAALMAAALLSAHKEPIRPPSVTVKLFQPGAPAAALRPLGAAPSGPRLHRASRCLLVPDLRRPRDPAPALQPNQEEVALADETASVESGADDGPSPAVDAGPPAGGGGPGPASVDGGAGSSLVLSEEQRRLIDGYARRIYRDRIAGFVRYPTSAQEAGVEGSILVRVVISREGTLRSLEVVSRSSNGWLSDAAVDAIRAAAPYPRLPDGVGDLVAFDLPFEFHLE